MFRSVSSICLCFMFSGAIGMEQTDTFRVYFDLDIPELNVKAKGVLDSLLYHDVINGSKNILIIGYADYLGSNEYNNKLSERRARNVKNYLAEMHIQPSNIKLCIGNGEIARANEQENGYAPDRKVDIVISNYEKTTEKNPAVTEPKEETIIVRPKQKTSLPDIKDIPAGATFVLNNIYFYQGRHFVREESLGELENLFSVLEANETIRIRIEGHICCIKNAPDALDEDTFDLKLSVNRAKYIYDYLVKQGIEPERMEYAGYGRRRPLVKERTPEDENKNRRVEIRILAK